MHRRIAAVGVVCIAFVAIVGDRAWSQAQTSRVALALADGKSVSGELIEATPAGVTVRANAKSAPVTKRWSEIKRVSSGLTRAQVLAEWRATKADLLCETCKGDGVSDCATCGGKGVAPATAAACATCGGGGSTGPCKTAQCVDGQVPCPQPCLKRESFTGPADADGKRWRSFRGKSGTLRISDAHVGELVVIEKGDPVMKGTCPTCNRTTRVPDPACKGTGKLACATCHGHGVTGDDCAACDDGKSACPTCQGSGLKPTPTVTTN